MAKDKKEVQIGIKSIKEICFSQVQIEDTSISDSDLQFSFGFSLNLNKDAQTMDVIVGVRYLYKGNVVLECQYSIIFHIVGFDQVVSICDDNKNFKASDDFIATLLGVGFGTLRGIVVVKTAGTLLNNHPIPIVNPSKIAQSVTKQAPK